MIILCITISQHKQYFFKTNIKSFKTKSEYNLFVDLHIKYSTIEIVGFDL